MKISRLLAIACLLVCLAGCRTTTTHEEAVAWRKNFSAPSLELPVGFASKGALHARVCKRAVDAKELCKRVVSGIDLYLQFAPVHAKLMSEKPEDASTVFDSSDLGKAYRAHLQTLPSANPTDIWQACLKAQSLNGRRDDLEVVKLRTNGLRVAMKGLESPESPDLARVEELHCANQAAIEAHKAIYKTLNFVGEVLPLWQAVWEEDMKLRDSLVKNHAGTVP